jgi:uncharacterized protein YecT (DUF1311 family)
MEGRVFFFVNKKEAKKTLITLDRAGFSAMGPKPIEVFYFWRSDDGAASWPQSLNRAALKLQKRSSADGPCGFNTAPWHKAAQTVSRAMSRLWIFLLAFFLFAPGLARAAPALPQASFNCAKAPGVDEKLICADPLLRQADHDLAQAYKAARNAASDKARLRADEHGWVITRDQECGITKFTVVNDTNRPRYVDCFLDEYDERMGDLAQMRLHPTVDPATISHPIRTAFGPPVAPNWLFSVSNILPGRTVKAMAWGDLGALGQPPMNDQALHSDALLTLTLDSQSNGAIFSTKRTQSAKLADVRDPQRFNALCGSDSNIVYLSGGSRGPFATVKSGVYADVPTLPLPIRASCGWLASELTIGDKNGDILHYGPTQLGATPNPRVVTLTTKTGTKTVVPPIRIDSRTHFSASYISSGNIFVLSQAAWPPGTDQEMERRWSKRNCAPYYEINAQTGHSTSWCIPFGRYATAAPTAFPLPPNIMERDGDATTMRNCGSFFYSPGSGILITESGAEAAPAFSPPIVAPNSCAFAYTNPDGTAVIVEHD